MIPVSKHPAKPYRIYGNDLSFGVMAVCKIFKIFIRLTYDVVGWKASLVAIAVKVSSRRAIAPDKKNAARVGP